MLTMLLRHIGDVRLAGFRRAGVHRPSWLGRAHGVPSSSYVLVKISLRVTERKCLKATRVSDGRERLRIKMTTALYIFAVYARRREYIAI